LVIFPALDGAADVLALAAFVSTAQQQNDGFSVASVIHAVAGAEILAQFPYAFAAWLAVAEIPCRNLGEPKGYSRFGLLVPEGIKPCLKRHATSFIAIMFDGVH